MEPQSNQIHGHAVMDMMIAADQAYTRESLRAAIVERFGEDAVFYTCSASGLDVDAMIDFLAGHGKLKGEPGALRLDPSTRCDDDE